eukprot:scaffold636305_cov126-Attheya_sp.AAC.1
MNEETSSPTLAMLADVAMNSSGSSLSSLSCVETGTTSTGKDSGQIEVVAVVPAKSEDPVANSNLNDVEVVADETEPTKKPKKGATDSSVPCSKLKSINGILIKDLTVDQVRSFCSRCGITGSRRNTKVDICREIVIAKGTYDVLKATGKLGTSVKDEMKKPKSTSLAGAAANMGPINRKRLCNVMFGDTVRPSMETRGKSLTKEDLTNGMKLDETLFRFIAT